MAGVWPEHTYWPLVLPPRMPRFAPSTVSNAQDRFISPQTPGFLGWEAVVGKFCHVQWVEARFLSVIVLQHFYLHAGYM